MLVDSNTSESQRRSQAIAIFTEVYCHGLLADYLEGIPGVAVDRGYLELDTALRATFGSGSPVLAVCAEYDALPQIGHACGHNVSPGGGTVPPGS